MINVSGKVSEKIKTHLCSIIFFRRSCPLCDHVERYGRTRHTTDDNIIRHMRVASLTTKARIQTHAQNVCYLLLFHGNNDYAYAPQLYIIRIPLVLFCKLQEGIHLPNEFVLLYFSRFFNRLYYFVKPNTILWRMSPCIL
jgi:hypothetical protein